MMRQQGKVIKWFDDKGYGFLSSDDGNEQIFSHISAFPKLEKRPLAGEKVTFQLVKDDTKGFQAKNVLYVNRPTSISASGNIKKTKSPINYFLVIFVISVITVIGFGTFTFLKHSSLSAGSATESTESLNVSNSIEMAKESKINTFKPVPTAIFTEKLDLNTTTTTQLNSHESYQCSGKKSCSQMTSCEEATYYLNHCPGTVMDGDGDGLPCEEQWCGH